MASILATRSSGSSSATRQPSRCRYVRVSRSTRCNRYRTAAFSCRHLPGASRPLGSYRAPAHISGRTDRLERQRFRRTSCRSTSRIIGIRRSACRAGLVVGSGQSGCEIAEELQQSGRTVFLSCGRAPWAPRRIGDHDFVWWALETGFLDAPLSSLPVPRFRLAANVLTTGGDEGHDLHLRTLQLVGVTLLGHFLGAEGRSARFAPDLGSSVAWGDQRNAEFMDLVRKLVAERGLPRPDIPEPEPFNAEAPEQLSLDGFGAVVFAGGFRPDYRSWVRCPGAFDELGFPIHRDGASTAARELYFVGVHFLRKASHRSSWGSARTPPSSPDISPLNDPRQAVDNWTGGNLATWMARARFWTERGVCMESETPPRHTAWAMSEENVEVVCSARRSSEATSTPWSPTSRRRPSTSCRGGSPAPGVCTAGQRV